MHFTSLGLLAFPAGKLLKDLGLLDDHPLQARALLDNTMDALEGHFALLAQPLDLAVQILDLLLQKANVEFLALARVPGALAVLLHLELVIIDIAVAAARALLLLLRAQSLLRFANLDDLLLLLVGVDGKQAVDLLDVSILDISFYILERPHIVLDRNVKYFERGVGVIFDHLSFLVFDVLLASDVTHIFIY